MIKMYRIVKYYQHISSRMKAAMFLFNIVRFRKVFHFEVTQVFEFWDILEGGTQ